MQIIVSLLSLFLISFHSLTIHDVDGNQVNMNSFGNKKILVVNIATGSEKVSQLAQLQQLQNLYSDSISVIAFPSNSFGHESRSNAQIKQFCTSQYNTSFLIAEKSTVAGASSNAVFAWLANANSNGEINAITGGDFQKFLIDKDGSLIGVFSSKISPLDSSIVNSIMTSY